MGNRYDGRLEDQLREVKITANYLIHPDGSVLIEMGDTKIICTAMVEEKTAGHLKGSGQGWVTAEYAMLPASTISRKRRDISRLKLDGRSQEIQRLIGRSLRKAVDLFALGERTIWIDCDVIQADGGTRTAAITGSFVALCLAAKKILDEGLITKYPIKDFVSAVSTGILADGQVVLDLCYQEDSNAGVDLNVIMSGNGEFIEIQGTGEEATFSIEQLNHMLEMAKKGNEILQEIQRRCLEEKGISFLKTERSVIVAATQNSHKIAEIEQITAQFGMNVIPRDKAGVPDIEIPETGETFEENSKIKAVEIMNLSGKISIADDSGLEVDALGGAPGVYSARFAGDHGDDGDNNAKLLSMMEGIPTEKRRARFVSVITLAYPDGRLIVSRGECPGYINFAPKGTNGFGYDPLFVPDGYEKTFAELTQEEKNKISHRAKALEKLKEMLSGGQ